MIIVDTVEIFLADNYVRCELSDGKKYRILLKDYENLPFECKPESRLENITIDTDKIGLSETNGYFDGDCAGFLAFLSKKYTIYKSAISKVALTDVPKKQLFQKLYFAFRKNSPGTDPGLLKTLCLLVCGEFEAQGYLDDRRYAADKAKYLKEYKKYGSGKIKQHLYQKGIPSDIINEILEDESFSDEESELSNMTGLLEKKYGANLDRLDKSDKNEIQKAVNMLVRNGYRYPSARNAVAAFTDKDIDYMIDYMEDED
ncbi:MAG: RecX family transcriptional regulator [Oscillospiraceae bacterium]|nr:RecX family transcriptional regulator [Oscillospiraceae bacterium]